MSKNHFHDYDEWFRNDDSDDDDIDFHRWRDRLIRKGIVSEPEPKDFDFKLDESAEGNHSAAKIFGRNSKRIWDEAGGDSDGSKSRADGKFAEFRGEFDVTQSDDMIIERKEKLFSGRSGKARKSEDFFGNADEGFFFGSEFDIGGEKRQDLKMPLDKAEEDFAYFDCPYFTEAIIAEGTSKIGSMAFRDCLRLKKAVLPGTVALIDNSAFGGCSALEEILIPEGVLKIGEMAFKGCGSLRNVKLPESLFCLEAEAFKGCSSLESIAVPAAAVEIMDSVFAECIALKSAVLPEGIAEIKYRTFADCCALESINVPPGTQKIEAEAFERCSSLRKVFLPDSIAELGDGAFRDCRALEEIARSSGLKKIGAEAFRGCVNLRSVSLDGIASIGAKAFADCSSLEKIVIGDALEALGSDAFAYCPRLSHIVCRGRSYHSIDDFIKAERRLSENGIIASRASENDAYKDNASLISAVIPEGTKRIGVSAFENCENLQRIVIPEGVTEIGEYAFKGCRRLSEVILPDSVVKIPDSAFCDCVSLKRIVLPDSLSEIADRAFLRCGSLEKAVLPSGLQIIGRSAFAECSSLKSIAIPKRLDYIGANAFKDCFSLESAVLPFRPIVHENIFEGCTNLSMLEWRDGLYLSAEEFIEDALRPELMYEPFEASLADRSSAYRMSDLTNACIPDAITAIGDNAFSDCLRLRAVLLSQSAVRIGAYAFSGCPVLERIVMPGDNIKYIGPWAFSGFVQSGNIRIPEGAACIGCRAFANTGIEEIALPDFVEYFGTDIFMQCSGLKKIKWRGRVYSSAAEFYRAAEALNAENRVNFRAAFADELLAYSEGRFISAVIPEGITSVGMFAFSDCRYLEEIVIPDSVVKIGFRAFEGCLKLKRIIFRGVSYTDRASFNRAVRQSGCSDTEEIWVMASRF